MNKNCVRMRIVKSHRKIQIGYARQLFISLSYFPLRVALLKAEMMSVHYLHDLFREFMDRLYPYMV